MGVDLEEREGGLGMSLVLLDAEGELTDKVRIFC